MSASRKSSVPLERKLFGVDNFFHLASMVNSVSWTCVGTAGFRLLKEKITVFVQDFRIRIYQGTMRPHNGWTIISDIFLYEPLKLFLVGVSQIHLAIFSSVEISLKLTEFL